MDTSPSKTKSNGHSLSNHFQRSLSPSGRFCSSSSTFSNFSARPGPIPSFSARTGPITNFSTRPGPLCSGPIPPSPSIRFSSISPGRSISVTSRHQAPAKHHQEKRRCACSPTTHPGSYRCGLHKNQNQNQNRNHNQNEKRSSSHSNNQLNMRRSAMTNSLVRIGTVEGELVKRALAALIRPSSHHLRRRGGFSPRPSRLSVMVKNGDS